MGASNSNLPNIIQLSTVEAVTTIVNNAFDQNRTCRIYDSEGLPIFEGERYTFEQCKKVVENNCWIVEEKGNSVQTYICGKVTHLVDKPAAKEQIQITFESLMLIILVFALVCVIYFEIKKM